MSFESFHLHPQLNRNIEALGYQEPTPIQAQAIPHALAGRDVMGLAQTGTGKTAAFALPILHRLEGGPKGVVSALVISPTRELAEQTHNVFGDLGRQTGWRSATVYGGVGMKPQVDSLRGRAEIVIACPGRLLDHIRQHTVDLRHVEVLVLDEADRMFDMGFLPAVREILGHLPPQRQNLLFAATMPDDVRALAAGVLHAPVTAQAGFIAPAETVSHALYPVPAHLKAKLLQELLRRTDTDSVLVFARTRHRARRTADQLRKAGFRVASLQGDMSQKHRQAAMDGFREGRHQILVATDIAARGLDVATISHVINFDMPDTVDAYTHRIGRAGRAARTGDAFTLVTPQDADLVRQIERVLGSAIERRQIEGFDYQAPAPAAPPPSAHRQYGRPPAPRPHSGPPSRHGRPDNRQRAGALSGNPYPAQSGHPQGHRSGALSGNAYPSRSSHPQGHRSGQPRDGMSGSGHPTHAGHAGYPGPSGRPGRPGRPGRGGHRGETRLEAFKRQMAIAAGQA